MDMQEGNATVALNRAEDATDETGEVSRAVNKFIARVQRRHNVEVETGPVGRFGSAGPGTSVYFRDPDGSLRTACRRPPCAVVAMAVTVDPAAGASTSRGRGWVR